MELSKNVHNNCVKRMLDIVLFILIFQVVLHHLGVVKHSSQRSGLCAGVEFSERQAGTKAD